MTICAVCLVLSSCCIIGEHSGVKRGNPPRNSSGFPGKIQAGMLHLLCLDSQLLLPPHPPWELRFCSLIYGIYFNLFQFIPPLTSMSDQPYKAIINIELLGSCWDLDKSLGGVQGNNHSRFFRVKKKKQTQNQNNHKARRSLQKHHSGFVALTPLWEWRIKLGRVYPHTHPGDSQPSQAHFPADFPLIIPGGWWSLPISICTQGRGFQVEIWEFCKFRAWKTLGNRSHSPASDSQEIWVCRRPFQILIFITSFTPKSGF